MHFLEVKSSRAMYRATLRMLYCAGLALLSAAASLAHSAAGTSKPGAPDIALFFQAVRQDEAQAKRGLEQIAAVWKDSYSSMLVDLLSVARVPPPPSDEEGHDSLVVHPRARVHQRLIGFLEKQTGQRFGNDLKRWRKWMWKLPYEPHPDYARFKGELYANVDPKMRAFFSVGTRSLIRLDEIDWGGVRVNGIPPLDHPKTIPAGEARYLKDDHIVFGIVVNGEARAYPKRILAWHELARDRVGGLELTIVYCTLCGTVIPYESVMGGKLRTLGTSGLLYRSNKLMFDEETLSLWSTLEGKPVVGKLAGSDLRLRAHPVVTTTWGEWKAQHPETTVLALDTGFKRDYSEGAAYREYFATDRLMFEVGETDPRLKNKAEVLVFRLSPAGNGTGEQQAVAIAADFLRKNPLYHLEVAGHELVVITSPQGANRVYNAGPVRLVRYKAADQLEDAEGRSWKLTEEALVSRQDPTARLPRVPAQRAFWFGWYAQFPKTLLIR